MMIVTVSTLSDLLIILCSSDLSIWEKIVFNDQNLCLDCFGCLLAPIFVLGVYQILHCFCSPKQEIRNSDEI